MSPGFPLNTNRQENDNHENSLFYKDFEPRSTIYHGTKPMFFLPNQTYLCTFRTEDFAERLNFKIAPHFEFQVIAVIGIFVNFCFCYLWEVRLI